MARLSVPSGISVVLGIVAGILALLNITTFDFVQPWQNLITFGLAIFASLGIAPLTGPALLVALHISHKLALTLAGLLAAATALVTTLAISTSAKGIIIGVLTLIGGILFGPAGGSAPATPPPTR